MSTNQHLSHRIENIHSSIIKEFVYLAEAEKSKGKDIISLGIGIPFYRMPQIIREEVIRVLQDKPDIDKYTPFPGLSKLRSVIAEESEKQLNLSTTMEEILVTPGSMAALLYSILAVIDKEDEIILLSPYFPSYAEQVALAEGRIVDVPLIKAKDKKYHLDIENIAAHITQRTRAIIINSPSNPSGTVYSEEELRELAKVLAGKNIYIITDEVYDYLVYEEGYFNIASIKELWPYVIRCGSFSKRFGMTGWRVGFIHTNLELVKKILSMHDNTIVCTPHISQEAVLAGLTHDIDEIEQNKQVLAKNREIVCERLDKLSDLFTYTIPQGAYYIFPQFNLDISSLEFAKKLLYEAGVVTIPGFGFGDSGEKHLRLSFGGSADEINTAFDRIENWWKEYKLRVRV
ncbi:MAG: pyridoxal phosphate-dependent aminotransferase [bacterium]|nr:pyridoxal phosphate-dependent aminotransferase [bacterium]